MNYVISCSSSTSTAYSPELVVSGWKEICNKLQSNHKCLTTILQNSINPNTILKELKAWNALVKSVSVVKRGDYVLKN